MTNQVQDLMNDAYAKEGICSKKIGNSQYTIKKLPALPAFIMGTSLIETLLPSVGSGIDNGMSLQEMFPEDRAMFTQIAMHLVESLGKVNKSDMVVQLTAGATRNGSPINLMIDLISISEMLELLEFALRSNFTDFFTVYLKEKGLEISSLLEVMMSKVQISEKSSEQ